MTNLLQVFPYKALSAVGFLYLLNWFIGGLHPNTWEIVGLPLFLCLLTSLIWNFFTVLWNLRSPSRSQLKISLRRLLLGLAILGLTIPAARLGNYVKTQLFLRELPRYQQLVDLLVALQDSHAPEIVTVRSFPDGFNDLHPYRVSILNEEGGVATIEFLTEDYGFPARHGGYLYRSNDDVTSLNSNFYFRDFSFYRIAPHWYGWSD